MRVRDLVHSPAVVVRQDDSVAHLCDLMQQAHVNGAPVVDEGGQVVGIVTEEDILYGSMGDAAGGGETATEAAGPVLVRDIMTSPAICATDETTVVEICRMMWSMHIHRIPIIKEGRVSGIVSAMDIVRAIAEGAIKP